ncbi:helix-turn-helix transcriptional regulator [Streptomyces sp. DSM 41921]|uniref:Helix-turn-helix transcriptional regulator n=1 Tax=Streptomyces dubilierae TaxID=3075533 RepID=A0ABU2PDS8_9ACTN|nr:helix-turn-helix transcriptional regulator [Streptomyces sp. DSM 41921]MDT0389450.1 helix-turn-helix transcriptional regulator [Streptomyces sp. DSM 41921]
MTVTENPMYSRQRLAQRLRKGREDSGLTQQQVAESFGWSPSKVIRIESGSKPVNVPDAMVLMTKYGITGEEAERLTELARAARQPSWYAGYKEILSPEFEAYLAYEESASIVRDFARNVIPGLLQTEEYSEALFAAFGTAPDVVQKRVELRMRRQKVLDTSAEFFYVLDESTLRRQVGSETVMRHQYEALVAANDRPNVKVLYVPFEVGIYPLFRSPYTIFEFPDSDDLVAYLEKPETEELLSEKTPRSGRQSPSDYLDAFWKVEHSLARDITQGDWL